MHGNMVASKAEVNTVMKLASKNAGSKEGDILRKGDFSSEIFFIGQVVGASDFNVSSDGIFVEAYLKYGTDWQPLKNCSEAI